MELESGLVLALEWVSELASGLVLVLGLVWVLELGSGLVLVWLVLASGLVLVSELEWGWCRGRGWCRSVVLPLGSVLGSV